LHYGGGVKAAYTAQITSALEKLYVLRRVKTIFAGGAAGTSKAKAFPGTDNRG